MNIGIIGRTHLLITTAKKLSQAGHKIVFIYTCKAEQYYQAKEEDFEQLATEMGCPFFNDLNVHSNIDALKILNADVCVSINWLSVLRNHFLDAFKFPTPSLELSNGKLKVHAIHF